jgi:atypical dual specificity phosphatase
MRGHELPAGVDRGDCVSGAQLYSVEKYIWWLIPDRLAGMPMPAIDPSRYTHPVQAHITDDVMMLKSNGVRSIVSLVKGARDRTQIWRQNDFEFLHLPISDGMAPKKTDVMSFIEFYRASPAACAVHCEGGIGRTGTMLAAYLITEGATVDAAVRRVRSAQPAAIESREQMAFLRKFAIEGKS